MAHLPALYTPRLTLRSFSPADASRVRELAGDRRVAATTAMIPHPYPEGLAEHWISLLAPAVEAGTEYVWAITLTGTRTPGREHDFTDTGHLVGCVGLRREPAADRGLAELGYWIGVPYWNKGFATEASRAVLKYAFTRLALRRIVAQHFAVNPASGRVLQKLGMTREGVLRQHLAKWGDLHDVLCYGVLQEEWKRDELAPLLRRKLPSRNACAKETALAAL